MVDFFLDPVIPHARPPARTHARVPSFLPGPPLVPIVIICHTPTPTSHMPPSVPCIRHEAR